MRSIRLKLLIILLHQYVLIYGQNLPSVFSVESLQTVISKKPVNELYPSTDTSDNKGATTDTYTAMTVVAKQPHNSSETAEYDAIVVVSSLPTNQTSSPVSTNESSTRYQQATNATGTWLTQSDSWSAENATENSAIIASFESSPITANTWTMAASSATEAPLSITKITDSTEHGNSEMSNTAGGSRLTDAEVTTAGKQMADEESRNAFDFQSFVGGFLAAVGFFFVLFFAYKMCVSKCGRKDYQSV